MKEIVDVQTGQVKTAAGLATLRTIALGSCVAIVMYDPAKKSAGMAHVMLPGKATARTSPDEKNKYAADAIDDLMAKMAAMGCERQDLHVAVVGGANVLKRPNDTIASDNVASNLQLLNEKGLRIVAKAVGGTERRNVSIDIHTGIITYAEGDSRHKELWRY